MSCGFSCIFVVLSVLFLSFFYFETIVSIFFSFEKSFGVDVNCRTSGRYSGQTALHVASKLDVVRILLDHGADINALDERGYLLIVSLYFSVTVNSNYFVLHLFIMHRLVDTCRLLSFLLFTAPTFKNKVEMGRGILFLFFSSLDCLFINDLH